METVVLQSLSKTYSGGKLAVRQVSLSLNQGEVFGFLGPNGAGKTTTVKLLNGMLSPTEGSCQVLGVNPAKEPEKVHRVSGVLTEHAQMYDNMTGTQNLIFYASLFDIPSREARSRTESAQATGTGECWSKEAVCLFHRNAAKAFLSKSSDSSAQSIISG